MTKAVRLYSEWDYKLILLKGNPQFENFYKEDLINMCKIAKKEIERLQKENKQLRGENNE